MTAMPEQHPNDRSDAAQQTFYVHHLLIDRFDMPTELSTANSRRRTCTLVDIVLKISTIAIRDIITVKP